MKKTKFTGKLIVLIVAGVWGIALICGLFFMFINGKNPEAEKELTELERLLTEDFEKKYPATPRQVVTYYTRIEACYHEKKLTDAQLNQLIDQMRLLWDDTLLAKTSRDAYYTAVVSDVTLYKQMKREILKTTINDIREDTDERNGDKLAWVEVTCFVKTDNSFTNSDMIFGLRKDENDEWKILGVTLKEKEEE